MQSIKIKLCDMKKVTIPIGFVGENIFTKVYIDCKKIFDEHPSAVPALSVSSPSGDKYPAIVVREGDIVIWEITASDLTQDGSGEIQLSFIHDEMIGKSWKARTKVYKSIQADGEAPESVQNWLDHAEIVLANIENAIPEGGTTGQVLAKASNDNYDTQWVDQSGGGSGGTNDPILASQGIGDCVTTKLVDGKVVKQHFFYNNGILDVSETNTVGQITVNKVQSVTWSNPDSPDYVIGTKLINLFAVASTSETQEIITEYVEVGA